MVKVSLKPKTQTVTIEAIPGSEITIREELTAGELQHVISKDSSDDISVGLGIVSQLIVDWNLEDEETGQKLPVNEETIKKFPTLWLTQIFEQTQVYKDIEELKKKAEMKKQ